MTPFLSQAITEMLPNAGGTARCAECGFDWTTTPEEARALVDRAAGRFHGLLGAATTATSPGRGWSPSAYVWHVGDLVRAWAERLHALGVAPELPWAGFDPDELAAARHYDALPAASAAWALERSVEALDRAAEGLPADAGFLHPEWGPGTVADALRWLAHEAVHHELDVRRGLGLT
jgi:hypothetical protein